MPPASPRSRGWTRADMLRDELRGGLPRARGDGPDRPAGPTPDTSASPRSRGWTRTASTVRGRGGGFPALAGMDPPPACRSGRGTWLPRARGDGPGFFTWSPLQSEASPRSRGWTGAARPADAGQRGFPALAGMDPGRRSCGCAASRLPRARGDGPGGAGRQAIRVGASPRSRGWTLLAGLDGDALAGFPALAGMDPARPDGRRYAAWLPRARGDGPQIARFRSHTTAASPRSRGWTLEHPGHPQVAAGFPALAGMDPS